MKNAVFEQNGHANWLAAGDQFMINSNVMVREVDDGAVLLHLDEGIYFGLDPIGLRIWHLLAENAETSSIVDTLLDE